MIRFGEFLFDAEARELRRGRKPVHVSPKAFSLLELLIDNAPKAVSKASLYESLWPRVFVEESNLKNLVSEVRTAIGEDARSPRFLKTVYGFGYAFRFDASVAPPGRFRVTHLAREFELHPGENVLGRDSDVSVVISMKSISRRHARILISGDTATLEDLGSKNGTWLRGQRVERRVDLADGDEIRLGSVPLVFRAAPAPSTETDIAE
ncbi:MAG: FHA domain-containing protein [Thermoanaerobaculia bacterium]